MQEIKRLYRSRTDKAFLGVVGGLVKYFGWQVDPVIVRLAFVFIMLATAIAPLFITYLAAGVIIPPEPENPGGK